MYKKIDISSGETIEESREKKDKDQDKPRIPEGYSEPDLQIIEEPPAIKEKPFFPWQDPGTPFKMPSKHNKTEKTWKNKSAGDIIHQTRRDITKN